MKQRIKFPGSSYGQIKKTRTNCMDELLELEEIFAESIFLIGQLEFSYLVRLLRTETEKDHLFYLHNMIKHNEILTPSLYICVREFFNFYYELQSCLYFGCARTLRCIIETALEACDFQSQPHRPLLDDLLNQYIEFKEAAKSYEDSLMKREFSKLILKENAWVAFKERYKLLEEAKRIAPSFKEVVNRLKSRQFFSESPSVSEELKEIYEKLSDYVHPSSEKIENQMDFRPSFVPRYKRDDFNSMREMSLKVLDIVQFLYVEAMSHFLGFEKANVFLQDLSDSVELPENKDPSLFKLPHVSKLASNIEWKVAQSENNAK